MGLCLRWAQNNYALATWEGMAAEMFGSSSALHTLFNRMSLLQWWKAFVHSLLKSCHEIESNLLKFTSAQDWMLSSTSKALWWCGGVCVQPVMVSNLLENNGALSKVGSKELCTCNEGCMAGIKEMFSLGWLLQKNILHDNNNQTYYIQCNNQPQLDNNYETA